MFTWRRWCRASSAKRRLANSCDVVRAECKELTTNRNSTKLNGAVGNPKLCLYVGSVAVVQSTYSWVNASDVPVSRRSALRSRSAEWSRSEGAVLGERSSGLRSRDRSPPPRSRARSMLEQGKYTVSYTEHNYIIRTNHEGGEKSEISREQIDSYKLGKQLRVAMSAPFHLTQTRAPWS